LILEAPNTGCAIWNVCADGYFEIVKLLLAEERVDPPTNENYAIQNASENGHLEIVKLLLADECVDPAANDITPFRMKANMGTRR
jgi:hypothetical protein